MLPVGNGVILIMKGMDKSSLTVQGFDFLGLINFLWKNCGSRKSVCYHLPPVISRWIHCSKDCCSDLVSADYLPLPKMRGQVENRLLCSPRQRFQIREEVRLLTGERSRVFPVVRQPTWNLCSHSWGFWHTTFSYLSLLPPYQVELWGCPQLPALLHHPFLAKTVISPTCPKEDNF